MSKITIYDVARRAGVSTATVSKVLNGTGRVSKATIERVEQVIEEMHYRPSILASALKKHQTYSIGLLVPDVANPFFAELARAVEDVALLQGYSVFVCSTDGEAGREKKQLDVLMRKHLDGVIVASSESVNSTILEVLEKQHIRVVCVDRVNPHSPYPNFATNHYLGSYWITEHLIHLGHRKLAMLLGPLYQGPTLERLRGFSSALEAYGIEHDNFQVLSGKLGPEAGYELAELVLQQKERPTAIVAANDLIAISALQKFQGAGISIPGELSLVGYDDIQMAQWIFPALTTVAQPLAEISRLAVECLLNENEPAAGTILLQPRLVIRRSTAAPGSALTCVDSLSSQQ